VVVPRIANHCPECGGWVSDNTASVVHGLRSKNLAKVVDAYRVGLIDQLFAERGGRDALDVVSRIAIENYALVCAQHKTIEARLDKDGLFTQTGRRRSAFDMLKAISETIDRLRAQLPPPLTSASLPTGYSDLSDDALIDKLSAMLEHLLDLRDHRLTPNTHRNAYSAPPESGDEASVAASIPAPEPEPERCAYCSQTVTRCAEIRTTRESAWRALHHSDPQERQRRAEDEADQLEAARRGWPTSRMIERAQARESPMSEEQKRQQEIRRNLGWESDGATLTIGPDGGTRRR
jgi:hypothetical protein